MLRRKERGRTGKSAKKSAQVATTEENSFPARKLHDTARNAELHLPSSDDSSLALETQVDAAMEDIFKRFQSASAASREMDDAGVEFEGNIPLPQEDEVEDNDLETDSTVAAGLLFPSKIDEEDDDDDDDDEDDELSQQFAEKQTFIDHDSLWRESYHNRFPESAAHSPNSMVSARILGKPQVIAIPTQLPFSPFRRHVYYRQHTGKLPELIEKQLDRNADDSTLRKRVLFATNLAYDATQYDVEHLFSQHGAVQSAFMGSLRQGLAVEAAALMHFRKGQFSDICSSDPFAHSGTVHIVFEDQDALSRSLNLPIHKTNSNNNNNSDGDASIFVELGTETKGIKRQLQRFIELRPNTREEVARIDREMKRYDMEQKREQKRLEAAATQPDEDGFVKVVSKKRKRRTVPVSPTYGGINPIFASNSSNNSNNENTDDSEDEEGGINPGEGSGRRNRRNKKLVNFYRWESIDAKKKQLEDLRRQFEQDKQKIAQLRAQRKFKPF